MPQIKKSEHGQVLVLIVIGLVALMGFTALAVDGGMIYSDRRYAQSVADSAALAGGGAAARILETNKLYYENFTCGQAVANSARTAAFNASKTRASSNFINDLDNNIDDHQGIKVDCVDNRNMGSFIDKYIDVHVALTTETQTAFAQLVFGGNLRNEVEATVRVRPRTSSAFGYAIVSTSSICSNGTNAGGVWFDGTQTAKVSGGIFSSSCIGKNGESGTVQVTGQKAVAKMYNGPYKNFSPEPEITTEKLPKIEIDTPDCSKLDDKGNVNTTANLTPGRYGRIRITNGEKITFAPGLYCVSGGITALGGELVGTDITIMLTGGNIDIGAQVKSTLRAPHNAPIPPGTVQNLLIRTPDDYPGSVFLRGTSDSSFLGTIYTPLGTIEAGGTSSNLSKVSCQLIANTVKIHGDVNIEIAFNTSENASTPSTVDLLN